LEERQAPRYPEMRRPLQGLRNVFLFNWPYYALGAAALIVLISANQFFHQPGNTITVLLATLLLLPVMVSLFVTLYVYDMSGLYEMHWLDGISKPDCDRIVNVTAGFDETSTFLADRFKKSELDVCDFFDQKRHTEPSIQRARRANRPFPGTRIISTSSIPLENESADLIIAFLSTHEIREQRERASFFKELGRALSPNGRIVVVEHLRDAANLLAYNVGALHFHSRPSWLATFNDAELRVKSEIKETLFITVFTLEKIGN
jgi:SAM-dependent methyltransferase